jgi:PAS domain S-box-containing protein
MSLAALRPNVRLWLGVAAVAAVYFLLALVALEPPFIEGDLGKIMWPASGFALGALLLYGIELWPGVALGALLATAATSGSILHALATAAGNSFEVVAAAYLLRHVAGFDNRMERARDVVAIILCGGVVGAFASAGFGTLGLYLSGSVHASALQRIWWKWGLSHAMGIVAVTPFILTAGARWMESRSRSSMRTRSGGRPGTRWGRIEACSLFALIPIVGAVAFFGGSWRGYDLEYLPFPLLIWAAFRFGIPGAATANLLTSSMAVWGTAAGSGPFSSGSSSEDLLLTWSFVNVSAITTLLLAAVVSQSRRAEAERVKSEAQYRMLIEQAADGIFLTDEKGRCTDVNSRGCDMLGIDRASVLQMEIASLAAGRDRDRVASLVENLAPGKAVISSWLVRRSQGAPFPAEVSAKRLEDGRIQAFVRDVTERLVLEEQLSQSQKMEAVGLLAGGIAHDFNNLLTAIIGHSDFALMRLPQEHKVRSDLEEVAKAAGRAADLTRKLLAFARKQIVEPRVVVLAELVRNLENMLNRILGEKVELVTRTKGEPWLVTVDPVQLEQVILNIVINARDAMPRGGRLDLECGNVLWTSHASHHDGADIDMLPGPYATLTATDTGVGMDEETLARVFEPFYTTKDRSQGTGLGLAVSYGIVKQAGGYIWARSERDRGSVFRIFLPRASETEIALSEEPPAGLLFAGQDSATGGETILLIEDEPLVRDLAVEVLNSRRYRVLTASDGEEALAIANVHTSEIHLAVTDVVLPAMGGKELARRLREARPGLKILFMSGYAEEQVVHQGVVERDVAFLAKPFTPAALSEKVRGVLDQA